MGRARCRYVVTDAQGNRLSGASVTVYEPNTVTAIAATMYADDSGGGTLANPLTVDANGAVLFYLATPQRVDLKVEKAGYAPLVVPDVDVAPAAGEAVTLSETQTLANKTLTQPNIADFTKAQHWHQSPTSGSVLDHTMLSNIGTKTHAEIDSHIATGGHVTDGNAHDHDGGDGAQIDHTKLSNIGTLAHTVIDGHIGNSSGVHGLAAGVHVLGTLGAARHVEGQIVSVGSVAQYSSAYKDVTFADAFSAAPVSVATIAEPLGTGQLHVYLTGTISKTGIRVNVVNSSGTDATSVSVHLLSLGAD